MIANVAIIRLKPNVSFSNDLIVRHIELLLKEQRIPNLQMMKVKRRKELPQKRIDPQKDWKFVCLSYLSQCFAENVKLKGERVLYVPDVESRIQRTDTLVCIPMLENGERVLYVPDVESRIQRTDTLVCIPMLENGHPFVVKKDDALFNFYSLDYILDLCYSTSLDLSDYSKSLIIRLERWLIKISQFSHSMQGLFSTAANERIINCVNNPVFEVHWSTERGGNSRVTKEKKGALKHDVQEANEIFIKMIGLEKCDISVINPLFGSGLNYNQQQKSLKSQYWSKQKSQKNLTIPIVKSETANANFLMHKFAAEGNADAVKDLIDHGYSVNQLDADSWAPIHYAAWYGHLPVLKILLVYGQCLPNITNRNGSTALHFITSLGHDTIAEYLLSCCPIDINIRDKLGRTALQLCESVPKPKWQLIASLLKNVAEKSKKLSVFVMDGTIVNLTLHNGINTTVDELHLDMIEKLNFPSTSSQLFALWISSESLQLQLKKQHKPIIQLQNWKNKMEGEFNDLSSGEKLNLFWKRNIFVPISEEKRETHHAVINLLSHEASYNYFKSLYPCKDTEAISLAAIHLSRLRNKCSTSENKAEIKKYIENNLSSLFPSNKCYNIKKSWIEKLLKEHKRLSKKSYTLEMLNSRFLNYCQSFKLYGATFFFGEAFTLKPMKKSLQAILGVNNYGVHLLNSFNKLLLGSFPFKNLKWNYIADESKIEFLPNGLTSKLFTLKTKQALLIVRLMEKLSLNPQENNQKSRSLPAAYSRVPLHQKYNRKSY